MLFLTGDAPQGRPGELPTPFGLTKGRLFCHFGDDRGIYKKRGQSVVYKKAKGGPKGF
jgi:hypothetical protein